MKMPEFVRNMTQKQKRQLRDILIAAALYIVALALPLNGVWQLIAFLVPYGVVGWRVLQKAGKNIAHGQIFDENFLMCVASIGAFAGGEYLEAVAVMLLYQVGELFEGCAVGKSRRSIANLMDIRPDSARVERGGEAIEVAPDEVQVGEIIAESAGTFADTAATTDASAAVRIACMRNSLTIAFTSFSTHCRRLITSFSHRLFSSAVMR